MVVLFLLIFNAYFTKIKLIDSRYTCVFKLLIRLLTKVFNFNLNKKDWLKVDSNLTAFDTKHKLLGVLCK